jgi:hypothetical protein
VIEGLVLLAQTLVAIPVITMPLAGAPADLQRARIVPQPDGRTIFMADLQSESDAPLTTCGVRLYRVNASGIARQTISSQLLTVNVRPSGRAEVSMPMTNLQVEPGDSLVAVLMVADGWRLDGQRAHELVLRAVGR